METKIMRAKVPPRSHTPIHLSQASSHLARSAATLTPQPLFNLEEEPTQHSSEDISVSKEKVNESTIDQVKSFMKNNRYSHFWMANALILNHSIPLLPKCCTYYEIVILLKEAGVGANGVAEALIKGLGKSFIQTARALKNANFSANMIAISLKTNGASREDTSDALSSVEVGDPQARTALDLAGYNLRSSTQVIET